MTLLDVRNVARRALARGRGATALEFALTASVLIGVIVFLFDLGFVLYTRVALDFVASRAARQLAVDSRQSLSSSQASFQSVAVCPLLAAFLACNQVTVALIPVTSYGTSGIPATGPTPFTPGQGGSLMLLQLSYQLPAFAMPLAPGGPPGGRTGGNSAQRAAGAAAWPIFAFAMPGEVLHPHRRRSRSRRHPGWPGAAARRVFSRTARHTSQGIS